jgi:glutathionylspermidine synthase
MTAPPFRAGPALDPVAFERVRRRAMFEVFKWDDVHGDHGLLCPFPLFIARAPWEILATAAEQLAGEALDAEAEILRRPELHAALGLPATVLAALSTASGAPTPGSVRVTRFDFHPTPDGLRITEGNCDVASGYVEASGFAALMAESWPHSRLAGDPAGALAQRFRDVAGEGATVGLLHLTTYSDDHQIMRYLAKRLAALGLAPVFLGPHQIQFRQGIAFAETAWFTGRLDAVFRFLPAAWLTQLPVSANHELFFAGGRTEICNPGHAVLTQSKRFPLIWDRLETPLPAWRAFLPETRSPDEIDLEDRAWVLKPALGFEGADVGVEGAVPAEEMADIRRRAAESPHAWAAQQRFENVPVETPLGPMFGCLGVYVVGRKAAGAYARLAPGALIGPSAREVCVLLENEE